MSVYLLQPGLSPEKLLESLQGDFRVQIREDPKTHLIYCDTFDWRLFQFGLTLTVTRIGGVVRLVLGSSTGETMEEDLGRRPEFAGHLAPGLLRDKLERIAGPRRLLPMARGEWAGTHVAILNEDQKTVVRLRIRCGQAIAEGEPNPIELSTRLELLGLKGYTREERKVRDFLDRSFDLEEDSRDEAACVFEAVGATPGGYSSSFHLTLDPDDPAAAATRKIHRQLFRTILDNREGVTRDWDIEFLHDFRVAVRRTRSALTQIKGVFPPATVDHFSEEFRWLGSRTGPLRDIDVYLLNLPAYKESLGPESGTDLEPMVSLLEDKRRRELRRLRSCLRSRRFENLLADWSQFLEGSDPGAEDIPGAAHPVREVASHRIWKTFNKVLKKGRAIERKASPETLHRLRIDCKKLRYLLTFFRSLFPADKVKPLIKELKRLQDHLGHFNDLQVQSETLSHLAEELMESGHGPPGTLLAMGKLMGKLEGSQAMEREAFHQHFRRFSRPENQKRFQRLFRPDS